LPKKFLTEDGFDLRRQVAEAPVGTDGHSFQEQFTENARNYVISEQRKASDKSSASGAQTELRPASKNWC
jgi:hypothetical protein